MDNLVTLPQHVAIIMDGNRRWAKKKHFNILKGHRAGIRTLKKIVLLAAKIKLNILTLFAFSSENWGRSQTEVKNLFEIFTVLLLKKLTFLTEHNIKLKIFGNTQVLEPKLQELISQAENLTCNNTGLNLNVGINYGGKQDILHATKLIVEDSIKNSWDTDKVNMIDENYFSKYLFLPNSPDIDLLIRTGGEERISNFLLWYLAYTELYFANIFWPNFTENDFLDALCVFQTRKRRFGHN